MKLFLLSMCVVARVSSFVHHPIHFRNSNIVRSMSAAQFVPVKVGGLPFSVAVNDIKKYPGSFFENIVEKERDAEQKTVTIERDGALFKYVNSFLVNDQLPRDKQGRIALDKITLEGLKAEAEFYGLDALSKECNVSEKKPLSELEGFLTIRKYLNRIGREQNTIDIEYSSSLVQALKAVWAPFCLTGKICSSEVEHNIYKNSTLRNLNVEELIAGATQSPFGRGMETVIDTTVRNSFEIPASELNAEALHQITTEIHLADLAPHLQLQLRPYKLVIYQEGGHFDAHRDTVRGDGHIGTLVVVLNSEYTGGELEVSHGGRTETVTGAYSWVAMHGDCLHKINPVTSGTRVSLIYDIYGTARDPTTEVRKVIGPLNDRVEEIGEGKFWEVLRSDAARDFHQIPYVGERRDFDEAQRRGLDEAQRAAIKAALDSAFTTHDSLIITLQHLYPECQANPAFLKGGDRTLYDLLSEQYDVQVVAATLLRFHDPEYKDHIYTKCSLFSSDAIEEASSKKPRVEPSRTKLVIPLQFDKAGLLDYTPYIDSTGNECQSEKTAYVVAGLQVTKRAV